MNLFYCFASEDQNNRCVLQKHHLGNLYLMQGKNNRKELLGLLAACLASSFLSWWSSVEISSLFPMLPKRTPGQSKSRRAVVAHCWGKVGWGVPFSPSFIAKGCRRLLELELDLLQLWCCTAYRGLLEKRWELGWCCPTSCVQHVWHRSCVQLRTPAVAEEPCSAGWGIWGTCVRAAVISHQPRHALRDDFPSWRKTSRSSSGLLMIGFLEQVSC